MASGVPAFPPREGTAAPQQGQPFPSSQLEEGTLSALGVSPDTSVSPTWAPRGQDERTSGSSSPHLPTPVSTEAASAPSARQVGKRRPDPHEQAAPPPPAPA